MTYRAFKWVVGLQAITLVLALALRQFPFKPPASVPGDVSSISQANATSSPSSADSKRVWVSQFVPPGTVANPSLLSNSAAADKAILAAQEAAAERTRVDSITDACFQMIHADPVHALNLAMENKLSKDSVLKNLCLQWAQQDLSAAYTWIVSQPADDRRSAMLSGVAFVWAQKDPAGAADCVVGQIPAGAAQNEAVMMVLHQWALLDLPGAVAWVQRFPNGPMQARAVTELEGVEAYERSLAQIK